MLSGVGVAGFSAGVLGDGRVLKRCLDRIASC